MQQDRSPDPDALPSVVVARHPNRGHIIDVLLFARPADAARYALEHEDDDLEVAVPTGDARGARYRQVLWDDELEELASP